MKKFFSIFILCFVIVFTFTGCSIEDSVKDIFDEVVQENLGNLEKIENNIKSVELIGNKSFALNSFFDITKLNVLITMNDGSTDEVEISDTFTLVSEPNMSELGLSKFTVKFYKRTFDLYIYIVKVEDIPIN